MANLGIEIKRKCPICGKVFIINTLESVYCSPKCSKIANKRKKDKEKKEALFVTYVQNVPDIREYLTACHVVAIYGIERSTLYRLAKLGKIPCINLDTRLMRFKRSELDLLFHYRRDLKEAKELPQKKLYSLEPEDCYTIRNTISTTAPYGRTSGSILFPLVRLATMCMFQKKKLITYINPLVSIKKHKSSLKLLKFS